ncbi:acyl-CoA dehydratase activase-related protein [Phascolarctobacterium sp.]|uniref:acyl-CoA dehydratase activase-related protein n=1 Tax=Phascolarctobacterium sp. TaxID=2049039 RepID=UPI002A839FF0|nr:acyl-CoA dehydratase activase-related protein [Phascolarctobacterium sp.]MDY5045869.1 acyl-CoA dehydratase activase-related protein [Phascolarctobacterium sp.]
MQIGLDIGSTTIKIAVLDDAGTLLFSKYQRHYSQIATRILELHRELMAKFPTLRTARLAISGSAGIGIAESCGIQFVQEVFAEKICTEKLHPGTDAVIELGGEDAKILFLGRHFDARMNDSCAGGTGAFIDQMAALLNVEADKMNELAQQATTSYTIASRCGVFAKSDIQPLLNQGAAKSDLAASIFRAVASQAVTGLSKGRPIEGNVLYLGGPLTFMSCLRDSFDKILNIKGVCPDNSLYYVAMGAAFCAEHDVEFASLPVKLEAAIKTHTFEHMAPLFKDEAEYQAFHARHLKDAVTISTPEKATQAFIGIDSGSTTIKIAVMSPAGELLDSFYQSNKGNPVVAVRDYLTDFYQKYPHCQLLAGAVTGYGEDLIRHAFGMDYGIVETMAHFYAAHHLEPDVDFILDIGGQDMKCLKIHNGAIDNIFLNEACSSGCGSFLQTFAEILGYSAEEFAQIGLFADMPVDLGSRCTVFMNSSVKQAQKDGASVANISAGLSISIVKNALYKVIRPSSKAAIGQHIVVQGGTFLNDCVLRAFEQEMGLNVVRPNIAGLMGAYGAALYAQRRYQDNPKPSSIIKLAELKSFQHTVKGVTCGLCNNHCHLTINIFASGKRFISGNRCERPITHMAPQNDLNLYRQKLELLQALPNLDAPKRGVMGIPMGLNMYELLPFWQGLLNHLGFKVVTSPIEDKNIYRMGQNTIPSDTVCYPAKLMHGHIKWLLDQGIDHIFYPCMTYNISEQGTENCYNCPVVAYYPEVLHANMRELAKAHFFFDYLGLLHKKVLVQKLYELFHREYADITKKELHKAVDAAFAAYDAFEAQVKERGQRIITLARSQHKPIVVLAGRPYHIDPKVNHSIDRLITTMGAALVSEDAVSSHITPQELNTDLHVLNQWTYHSRLYAAAKYVTENPDMHMIQLVSFGCGCDAITADECRRILEEHGRIYTQIKIDDIDNLGAAKIRIRSLFSAANLFDLDTN